MLQALESTADQIDRLAEIIDECLTLAESGVPMSATTRQRYAAKMAEHITDGVIASTPDFASLLTNEPDRSYCPVGRWISPRTQSPR